MKKKVISVGKDYTSMLSIFKELISKSGIRSGEDLVFAGCPGPCFSMATFFSSGMRELNLNLYFAVDSDIHQLWRLEHREDLGVVAKEQVEPLKANVIVLMSGLCTLPLEKTLEFIEVALRSDGIIIGEAPAHDLFEERGWGKSIPFHFLFEFAMETPTSFEVEPRARAKIT